LSGGQFESVRVSFFRLLFYNDARAEIEEDKDILPIDCYFRLDRRPEDRERILPAQLAVSMVSLKPQR
jgi:hypothetical protein